MIGGGTFNQRRTYNRCNTFDTHEYLKNRILGSDDGSAGSDSGGSWYIPQTQQISAPQKTPAAPGRLPAAPASHGFEDVEVYLDSARRDGGDLGSGEVLWVVRNINNSVSLENCVQITVGDFYFPKIQVPLGAPDIFYYSRVYMEITSAPTSDATLAHSGIRYHFEFEVENLNGQAVHLVPVKNTFYFKNPINSMDRIGVRFLVPWWFGGWSTLAIPKDVVDVEIMPGTNPARLRLNDDPVQVVGHTGTLPAPGVAVAFSGAATDDPTVNSQLLNPSGLFITEIGPDYVDIGSVDATGVGSPGPRFNMFVAKNRFAIPMRFTLYRERRTNHLVAVHH